MAPGDDISNLDYICLTNGNFEILLRELLLVKSYRVEVFTKVINQTFSKDQSTILNSHKFVSFACNV